jgi:replicative DNA helicase
LDEKLGGLRAGNLVIVAARPSMGKTALATSIANNVASAHKPVCFASLEMSCEELGNRLLASRLGISGADLCRGINVNAHMAEMLAEQRRGADLPIHIDDSGALTIAQLHTRLRRRHRKRAFDLVIVDYLQLLRGAAYRGSNRTQEVAEISGGLKAIAKELAVPVLALSQLNRATETRDDKRPHLADLRDSGAIEQDADVVMFVHRPAYYLEREQPSPLDVEKSRAWEKQMAAAKGRAEIIIAKHRNGPTGIVDLAFDETTMTFSSFGGACRA